MTAGAGGTVWGVLVESGLLDVLMLAWVFIFERGSHFSVWHMVYLGTRTSLASGGGNREES